MNKRSKWPSHLLLIALVFALGGGPDLLQAQQTSPQTSTSQSATPDPSRGPQQPATTQPSETPEQTPETPATVPNNPNPNGATQTSNRSQPQNNPAPTGAAAAQRAETAGGAASRPAGSAIAPAKQHQTRSLLIKIGAVAAVGAAAGIIYGLSRGTPSLPPGARTTASAAGGH
ncbi:MAG TPA: hypothetical protein VKW78_18815 [Terriglobales bacterium]|nr:hypothetical protein [Terriglobales bacterium]